MSVGVIDAGVAIAWIRGTTRSRQALDRLYTACRNGSVSLVMSTVNLAEVLIHAAKYARASGARVALSRCNGTLRVEIVDDGVGGADASQGSGLRGLEDRVSAVRGSFRVETRATGGTRVLAEIPCDTRNRPADGDPAATPGAAAPDY